MNDKNYGFIKKIISQADDKDLFEPFHAALRGMENVVSAEVEVDEDE